MNDRGQEYLTLQDIGRLSLKVVRRLVQHKIILIGAVIIGIGLGITYVYVQPTQYAAELSFMVREDDAASGGQMASVLLGQLGLGGTGGEYNLDKIVALAKSRSIIDRAIYKYGDSLYLKSRIRTLYEQRIANDLEHARKKLIVEATSADVQESLLRRAIYRLVVGVEGKGGLLSTEYEELTGILMLSVKARDAEIAKDLTEVIYNSLSDFYISGKTRGSSNNVRLLSEKADSLKSALNILEGQLASLQDRQRNLTLRTDYNKASRVERSIRITSLLYSEVIKNRETAGFILQTETPVFEILDKPNTPIEPEDKEYAKAGIIGGLIGGILTGIVSLLVWGAVKAKTAYEEFVDGGADRSPMGTKSI